MEHLFKRFAQQLPAFILLGIVIALTVGLFIVFLHVILWGILLGSILCAFALIKQYFSAASPPKKHKGQIFDHDPKK